MTAESSSLSSSLELVTIPFPRIRGAGSRLPDEDLRREEQLYIQLGNLLSTLATTNSLLDVNKISNVAEALRVYAKLAKDPEKEFQLAVIRLRANRRLGELSARIETSTGFNLPNVGPKPVGKRATLKAAGISKDYANQCEQVARIDEQVLQEYIDERRARRKPVSIAEVVKDIVKGQMKVDSARRAALPDALHTGDLSELAGKGFKFGTIYADPPWQYENTGSRGAAEKHYSTMSVKDIAALPVGALAADSAHLHLWTTSNFLFEAKEVLDAWGFTYKGLFVWIKPQMGMGSNWRVSNEFLLLGTRGSGTFADKGLCSWGTFDRRAHSEKPQEVRAMIERASPGPRLELFGRAAAEGWVVWGNQAPRADFAANVGSFFEASEGEDSLPTEVGGLEAA